MKISVEQLYKLFAEISIPSVKYLTEIVLPGQTFLPNDLVIRDHLPILTRNSFETVDVLFSMDLYNKLSDCFPVQYRRPYGTLDYTSMDRLLEEIEQVNSRSQRKRNICIINEIYDIDSSSGRRITLIRHNETMDYSKWNSIKRSIPRQTSLCYRHSEVPIIVFVDMGMESEREYVDRFKQNTDLICLLVSRQGAMTGLIAPDFIPTCDVISVTDPDSLLDEYRNSNARMIIIGDELNDLYRTALRGVMNYDRYVRLMVVPRMDHSRVDHLMKQIQLVYNSNRWE